MKIDTRLLKILLVLASASFFAMLGELVFLSIYGQPKNPSLTVLAMVTTPVTFLSLLGMWVYWIYYFWRTKPKYWAAALLYFSLRLRCVSNH